MADAVADVILRRDTVAGLTVDLGEPGDTRQHGVVELDPSSQFFEAFIVQLSISVFSVVYFSIDVARGEQTIANTPSERPKTKFPLSMRLPDPADGDIHY